MNSSWKLTFTVLALPLLAARHIQRANITFLDGHAQSFAGNYLGCGVGAVEREDVRWQTRSEGINHAPLP